MNERIWELKRQAMLFAQEKCDGQTTDMHGNLRSNIWTEKFAELVRADEREACAKVCDRIVEGKDPDDIHSDSQWMALTLAVEIRARSNT